MKSSLKKLVFGSIGDHRIRYGTGKGIKMHIDPAHKLQRILGMDENELMPIFTAWSLNANAFFDIGASDGFYGLMFRKCNQKGKVFLFEGQKRFIEEQKHNFLLNNFNEEIFHFSRYVASKDDNQTISLDTVIKDHHLENSSLLIKIDVDGGELEVLKGVKQTLQNYNCKLIVETHATVLEGDCILFLEELGYTTEIINPAWWRVIIPEKRPIEHNRWFLAEKPT